MEAAVRASHRAYSISYANGRNVQLVSMLPVPVSRVCTSFLRFRANRTNDIDFHSGFIGFPSVGKSTLMSRLTGQHSEGSCETNGTF